MQQPRIEWNGFAISMLGSSHERDAKPCQDTSLYLRPVPDCCFLIVADGAGSASESALGSSAAVSAVSEILTLRCTYWRPEGEPAWAALMLSCFQEARNTIEGIADAEGIPLRDLATTLTVVGIRAGMAASASIGDCAAIIDVAEREPLIIAVPEHGEYANETFFLTQSRWVDYVRFRFVRAPVRSAVAFSDSLEYVALYRHEVYQPFFSYVIRTASSLPPDERAGGIGSFLATTVRGERTDDDISLVGAWLSGADR